VHATGRLGQEDVTVGAHRLSVDVLAVAVVGPGYPQPVGEPVVRQLREAVHAEVLAGHDIVADIIVEREVEVQRYFRIVVCQATVFGDGHDDRVVVGRRVARHGRADRGLIGHVQGAVVADLRVRPTAERRDATGETVQRRCDAVRRGPRAAEVAGRGFDDG